MDKYWQTKVEKRYETDKGKVQKVNEVYLVKAFTPTDAEAKVHKLLEGEDFTIKAVVASKILEVIE